VPREPKPHRAERIAHNEKKEAPNPKHQSPNNHQFSMTKIQKLKSHTFWQFEYWEIVIYLGFGIWLFGFHERMSNLF
jgi:hypothetical protein